MNLKEKIALLNLRRKVPQIKISKILLKDNSVDIYKSFLEINLSYNVDQICRLDDDSEIQTIQEITFSFRDLNISFSIEILNQKYKGKYTIWCPELRGCITEGNSKKEAFNNLLWAISETLVVSYDYLKFNPLTFPVTPLPTYSHVNFSNSLSGYSIDSAFITDLIQGHNLINLYVGKKHLLFKKENDNGAILTILFAGINDLTKFCYEKII